jgi:hypothetical protein
MECGVRASLQLAGALQLEARGRSTGAEPRFHSRDAARSPSEVAGAPNPAAADAISRSAVQAENTGRATLSAACI